VLALVVGSVAACHRTPSSSLSADDARAVLFDRNWIDRMPENHTDRLHVYRFVPSMGGGVFQDRTLFKGTFELFTFTVEHGDHIVFNLPETHEKVTSQFTIEKVDGPAPFDLKLTLWSDPRGPRAYFGMRAETDRDGHVLEHRLAEQALATKR
ncbi:MAG TPA: hypothetical protein VHN14_28825, partial [Kofleriaceae bacterium]|nr:hypothetical protein [Kofleriaceae bacterium]